MPSRSRRRCSPRSMAVRSERRAAAGSEIRIWPPWPAAIIRAVSLSGGPYQPPPRRSASPTWIAMRTLSPSSICQPACASAVCAATAAATASSTDSNTAANESPAMENEVPPRSWIAVLSKRSCWARSAAIASVCCAHSRVDPTMSVKRNTPRERPAGRSLGARGPTAGAAVPRRGWAVGRPRRWPGRAPPARVTVRSPPPRRAGSGRPGTAAGLRSGVPDCASARISMAAQPVAEPVDGR